MVQHKQTRATYALKYINKMKAVKMKAVGNIIQERRLLEKVGCYLSPSLPRYIPRRNCRSTTRSPSTFGTRSKTTRTASSSSTSCSAVTFVVRRVFDPGPGRIHPLSQSRVQSICCESTLSVKRQSDSTRQNSHPPLSTFTNTVSFTGNLQHSCSSSSAPTPPS